MRPIESYLEEVKKKAGLRTDKELALRLGVKPSAICQIKNGSNTPSQEHCKKLAAIAGDSPEKALLLVQLSKAPEAVRPAWERIFKAAVQAGVVTSFALLTLASPAPSEAAVQGSFVQKDARTIHYAT